MNIVALLLTLSVMLISIHTFNSEYMNSNVSPSHIEKTKAEYMKSGSDYMLSLEE